MADLFDKKLDGLHLIEASAGTGKTYTITALVVRLLLERRLTIQEILVVTYTEAAAADLHVRIRRMLVAARDCFSGQEKNEKFLSHLRSRINDHDQARRDLTCALNDFDEAAIYTIHGFCQRMLKENGLESATLFDVELAQDLSALRRQVVCDYWRRHVTGLDIFFLRYLKERLTLEKLVRLLDNQRPNLTILPTPSTTPPNNELEQTFFRLHQQGVAEWPDAAEAMAAVLHHPDLNGTKYRKNKLATWLQDIHLYFTGPPALPPDSLLKISQQYLNTGVKKNGTPPAHAFCVYIDQLLLCAEALQAEFDRRLLDLKSGLFPYAEQAIKAAKEEQRLLGFDDLLTRLHKALSSPQASALARRIRTHYPAALIDEFQDTDPIQFEIFHRIHDRDPAHLLYLIGDPKQAIYNFRGADIFAYLAAARGVRSHYSLEENYRSEPGLIQAVNALFHDKPDQASFVFDEIRFHPVKWPGGSGLPLRVDQGEQAPMQIMLAHGTDEGKQLSAPLSRQTAITATCAEIVRLLELAAQGQARLGERALEPGDIAVLVRTNHEAGLLHGALANLGVASVVKSTDNLFASHEARELIAVLEAVSRPSVEKSLVAALATDILGWSARDLFARGKDEATWDGVLERFGRYHRLWQERGFMSMFQALINGEQVRERLLRLLDGERRLTNVLHLGEVLQGRGNLDGRHLIDYLRQEVADGHNKEHEQRLESDAQRLQIVTIHKAKGLQYPVVFCPFLWGGSKIRKKTEIFFHETQADLILDIGSPELNDHREIALREELAENLRLAYVALTRARNRCYLIWGPFHGSHESALGHLLHARPQEARSELCQRLQKMSGPELGHELADLLERAQGEIAVVECCQTATAVNITPDRTPPLHFSPFTATIDRSWQVTSFSRLTAGLHQEACIVDHDRSSAQELGPGPDTTGLSIFDFPKGAGPGTFLHHLFEHLDFRAFRMGQDGEVEQWLLAKLSQFGFAEKWQATLATMLKEVMNAPLPGQDFCLADLAPTERLNELEFHLPLAPSRAADLQTLFSRHDHGGGPHFQARLTALDYTLIKGFLKGFVDLVFCRAGRYYIIDWKSNYLDHGTMAYDRPRLQNAMVEHNYILQYHLYTVALHRYLAGRLVDYQYERHFGGVFYIFLRGVGQGSDSGIFADRPSGHLIAELADLLALPGRDQGGQQS